MRYVAAMAAVLVLLVPAASIAAPSVAAQTAFDSTVTIDVYVEDSGDARINVSTTYDLNSTEDREAFDSLAANFSDGRVGFSERTFEDAADAASEATGRTMEITDVRRIDEVRDEDGNTTGILALELIWTNFAEPTGSRIVVDDVFETGWLDHLDPGVRLRLYSDYGVQDAPIPPRGGMLVWDGPYTFEEGGPAVVFEVGLDPTTASTTTTDAPGSGGFDGEFQLVLAIVAVLLVGGFLAYVWSRRDGPGGVLAEFGSGVADVGGETVGDDAVDPDGEAASDDDVTDGNRADDGGGGADDADDGDGPAPAVGGTGGEEADVDETLLSDEERVERLLVENGGRMKQANIVKGTGWSNAKVSQLLSAMDEEDRIDKLRLGRENLIILEDEEDDDESIV